MITYTVPLDCPNKTVAGKTLTGGIITRTRISGKAIDVVKFGEILVGIAGKPELEAILIAHNAAQAAADKAAAEKQAAYDATPEGQREKLVIDEYNTYSPDSYPGSKAWLRNKRAADALEAFDAAHPEIVAAVNAASEAKQAARYDALSYFVKMGS